MLRHRLPELVPPPTELPPRAAALRVEVRAVVLEEERAAHLWVPRADA
jgi:acyl-CoA dehydrogenase